MPRRQLIELHDQAWFPHAWRRYVTDILHVAWSLKAPFANKIGFVPPYQLVSSELKHALTDSRCYTVVDLCSGGGGPVDACQRRLARSGVEVDFILTDLFPNLPTFERLASDNPRISYVAEPVDATSCTVDGFRTLFTCFHHFPPQVAQQMISDAVLKNQGIAIFELTKNSLSTILFQLILMPLLALLTTPFLRAPCSLGRLFWTYIIPIVPIVLAFDSFMSNLRSYSFDELMTLVAHADKEKRFAWRFREKRLISWFPYLTLTSLVGTPKATNVIYGKKSPSTAALRGGKVPSMGSGSDLLSSESATSSAGVTVLSRSSSIGRRAYQPLQESSE